MPRYATFPTGYVSAVVPHTSWRASPEPTFKVHEYKSSKRRGKRSSKLHKHQSSKKGTLLPLTAIPHTFFHHSVRIRPSTGLRQSRSQKQIRQPMYQQTAKPSYGPPRPRSQLQRVAPRPKAHAQRHEAKQALLEACLPPTYHEPLPAEIKISTEPPNPIQPMYNPFTRPESPKKEVFKHRASPVPWDSTQETTYKTAVVKTKARKEMGLNTKPIVKTRMPQQPRYHFDNDICRSREMQISDAHGRQVIGGKRQFGAQHRQLCNPNPIFGTFYPGRKGEFVLHPYS